jgi:hypothetical protein
MFIRAVSAPRRRLPLVATSLVVGVLIIELGFIAAYVGALHAPTPHDVPVAVVNSGGASTGEQRALAAISGTGAVHFVAVSSFASARAGIDATSVYAVIIVGGSHFRLDVAAAANPFTASAVTSVVRAATTATSIPLSVVDLAPLPVGDAEGLSPFYLAVGWVVGGYLAATMLGLGSAMSPESRRAALSRVVGLVAFAVASGLIGAALVDYWLGALEHHFVELAGIGALVVLASALATMAFQTILGIVGSAITVAAFVVVGNPSSGGPFAAPLLPRFFGVIGRDLPPGAGTSLIRSLSYFGGADLTRELIVLGAYAAGGAILSVAFAGPKRPYIRLLPE